ncbi:hypothetical protein ABBQ38_011106 [Trebouxia sp. C0009 RCD-2024]
MDLETEVPKALEAKTAALESPHDAADEAMAWPWGTPLQELDARTVSAQAGKVCETPARGLRGCPGLVARAVQEFGASKQVRLLLLMRQRSAPLRIRYGVASSHPVKR